MASNHRSNSSLEKKETVQFCHFTGSDQLVIVVCSFLWMLRYLGEQYQIKRCNNNFVAAIKFLALLGLFLIFHIYAVKPYLLCCCIFRQFRSVFVSVSKTLNTRQVVTKQSLQNHLVVFSDIKSQTQY